MEKSITIELYPAMDILKRAWRPIYRATIVAHRLKRARIWSRAFFRQTVLAHQRVSRFNHDQTYGVSKAEMLSFLKSLRNMGTNCTLLWKPSEEDKLPRFYGD